MKKYMTYRSIIDYMSMLGDQHKDIKFTAYGDYDRILGAERDRIEYPAIWIESPEATIVGDLDAMKLRWEVSFVILINAQLDDAARREANLDTAMTIAKDLIARIRKDVIDNELIGADISSSRLTMVWSEANDNDQGWRYSFFIDTTNKELCFDATKWDIPVTP